MNQKDLLKLVSISSMNKKYDLLIDYLNNNISNNNIIIPSINLLNKYLNIDNNILNTIINNSNNINNEYRDKYLEYLNRYKYLIIDIRDWTINIVINNLEDKKIDIILKNIDKIFSNDLIKVKQDQEEQPIVINISNDKRPNALSFKKD